jgi:hypothetical protein
VPTIVASGSDAVSFARDFAALIELVETNLVSLVLLMRPRLATQLSGLNIQLTRNVGATGGDISLIPVITSAGVPQGVDGKDMIVLLDSAELLLADDGIEMSASEQAIVQMLTTPDNPLAASSVLQSLWQTASPPRSINIFATSRAALMALCPAASCSSCCFSSLFRSRSSASLLCSSIKEAVAWINWSIASF